MFVVSKISSWFRPYRNRRRQKYFLKKHGAVKDSYKILSSNCIGGMCYHDANLEFLTPTINCSIKDFLTFCLFVDKYILFDLVEDTNNNEKYPVGILVGKDGLPSIKINFVHYSSFKEAKEKWVARSARMASHEGKVCIIYCTSNLSQKQVEEFLQIQAYKKVCFYKTTSVSLPDHPSSKFVHVPLKYQKVDYSNYTGLFSRKRYYDYFFDINSYFFD